MLILQSIELKNFRTFAEAEAAFAPDGLTTVIGRNGAGKSSLVSVALYYCLYGKSPSGVNLKSLRRQGAPESEPLEVTATLLIDDKVVQISRFMKGKNSTSMAEVSINGEVVADTKAGAATELIEKLVGPPETFSTVYLVQQKALDALVQAKGADRRKLIERLSGIEKLQEAVDAARADARAAQAARDAIVVADPAPLEQRLAELADQQAVLSTTVEQAAASEDSLRERLDAATAQVSSAEQAARGTLQRRLEWQRLDSARQQKATEADRARVANDAAHAALIPVVEPSGAPVSVEAERAELADLRDEKVRLTERLNSLPSFVDDTVLMMLQASIDESEFSDSDSPKDAAGLRDAVAALRAELAHVDGQLSGLQDTCPTCGQATDVSGLRADLTAQQEGLTTRLEAAEVELADATLYNERLSDFRALCGRLAAETDRVASARALLAERTTIEERLTVTQTRGEELVAEVSRIETENARLVEETAAYEQAIRLQNAATEAAEQLKTAEQALAAAAEAVEAFGPEPEVNESLIEDARAKEAAVRAELDEAVQAARAARAALAAIQADSAQADADLRVAQQGKDAYESANNALRVALAVRDAVTDFREKRLASLAPTLQESAGDHINTLSGGRFVGMELSEDFEPTLIDSSGHARPVSMLSGGEESLTALALRLAIGDEIAEGAPGSLLVLDEVLGAMDEERRVLIVDALRRLNRQVVMVDHSGVTGDHVVMVDAGGVVTTS